jgi:glycosyltransferase involved in cell wall biosynthesis
MKKLKILDWYCHQGHQYEFFKTGHDFFLTDPTATKPNWNIQHRPLNNNVHLIQETRAVNFKYDVVMIRSPINVKRYNRFIKSGAIPIGVVQTTSPFPLPKEVEHVIWNSYDVMKKWEGYYKGKKNHYIVHGYDQNEFKPINIEKNGKVLAVANVFKRRSQIMGYPLLVSLNNKLKNIDVLGHGNEDIQLSIGEAKTFQDLLNAYNEYSVFLNTTAESAMPRSRAEAMMCGSPIVTTNNFDISRYLSHKNSAILSNDFDELHIGITRLLASKEMRLEYGKRAREVAIKYFNLKDYLDKWNNVFNNI